MPKVVYTPGKGLVQSAGSGFQLDASVGLTNGGQIAGFVPDETYETKIAAGALSVATYMSYIHTGAGAMSISLPAGTVVGQLKKLMMIVDSGDATLTISNPFSAATDTVVFSNVGDTVELVWSGSYWRILAAHNVASGVASTPVVS